jgi:hypothetical protein
MPILKRNFESQKSILSYLEENNIINNHSKILDVGGGKNPFEKANYIIDFAPYDENKLKTTWPNNIKSACNKKNYFVHDICSRKPFPFDDNFFDFTTCTQTLEDIRDPIWVLDEISRISKAGYIDTPSIRYERSSVASKYFAGAPHHRWFVDLDENDKVRFFLKYAFVHAPFMRLPLARNFYEKTMSFVWKDEIKGYEFIDLTLKSHEIIGLLAPELHKKKLYNYYLRIHSKFYLGRIVINFLKNFSIVKNFLNKIKNYLK